MSRISVCMIVKNEEKYIEGALKSVLPVAWEIIVADTGSSDKTPQLAKEMSATVMEIAWNNDFSQARNAVLEKASGDWIFIIDADERLQNASVTHVHNAVLSDLEGYLVKILNYTGTGNDMEISTSVRLFRNRPAYRFTGAIHEQISPAIQKLNPSMIKESDIFLEHFGYLDSVVKAKNKKQRNYMMAKTSVDRNPENAFYRFNYGLELFRMDRLEESIAQFEQASRYLDPAAGWGGKLYKTWVMALIRRGFLKKASSVAKSGLGLYPGFTDLHYVLGLAHYENENYRQAEYVFKQCISMGDAPVPPFVSAGAGCGSHKAKWALGRVYLAQGMYAEACREFRQAFEGNPQLISYLVHMGIAHRAAGTRDNFVTYLKSLDKDDVLKANVLFGAWLYPECLNILETIDESRPELQYLKAVSMAGTGAYDKAEALYQELSSETSKMDTSLVTLTFCHLCMGKCGLETVSDWPGKDKKLLFQMFLTRTLLTLEDKLVKNPQDSFLRENLDTIRKSAKALGFREI